MMFVVVAALAAVALGEYRVVSLNETNSGVTAVLEHVGPFGTEAAPKAVPISPLSLSIEYVNDDVVRVKFYDSVNTRWEVPDIVDLDRARAPTTQRERKYRIEVESEEPFRMAVVRVADGVAIWNSTVLFVSDQYLQWGSALPANPNIYGLGERVHPFRLDSNYGSYTMFNSDSTTPFNKPLYGSHPMYLEMREGAAHAVFLLNSNAMEVNLNPNEVIFRTVGGVLDFYFMVGPGPEETTRQYHDLIGHPSLQPYWMLGFHMCRYGYPNLDAVETVVNRFEDSALPLDAMWVDIDYMQDFKVWTTDAVNYPIDEFGAFASELLEDNKKLFLITDPCVKQEDGYPAWENGLEKGVFIREPDSDAPVLGKVWPSVCAFPDWTNPETGKWWTDETKAFHDKIDFRGYWIDMNEPSSFCDGRCKIVKEVEDGRDDLFTCDCSEEYPPSALNDPEFVPGGREDRVQCRATGNGGLDCSTISMSSRHYGGVEYNLHNLYGHLEAVASRQTMEEILGTRGVVISRSTFPGTGVYSGHWLGDNRSNFYDLYASIGGVLNFQLFGIPMVGADVCGFAGPTTPELCARWMQLGAFHPFYRNHNGIGEIDQEPYALGEEVLSISIASMRMRYELLPFWYTLHSVAHIRGGTVVRPLFFEFPAEAETYGIDTQFLVGPSLLVTPVLEDGARSVEGYFPVASWYEYSTGALLKSAEDEDRRAVLDAPLDYIPVHIRGGSIVPRQEAALTTAEVRMTPYTLVVALDERTGGAAGELYVDDGDSIDPITTEAFSLIDFVAEAVEGGYVVSSDVVVGGYAPGLEDRLGAVLVYGLPCAPAAVDVNGAPAEFEYNGERATLSVDVANAVIGKFEARVVCGAVIA